MVLAGSETTAPHVAVLVSPGMGHIIPLLEFAKRLAVDHGCHVSFLNITFEASAAQIQLLHSANLPPSLHVIDLPPADVTSGLVTEDTPILTRLCLIVQENLKCLKSVLLSLDNLPKALVIDMFCTQAFDVCEELSIPVYSFFTASPTLLSFSLYLPTLDTEVIDCQFVDLPEPVQVPGCSPVRTEDLPDPVRNRKIDEYKWYLFHVSRLHLASGIFLNAWEDLEPATVRAIRENPFYHQVINTPPVYTVGPIIKDTETVSESESGSQCLTWLDKQPRNSVVFVALGSGGTLTAQQITEVAWGLELSKQRFIWVIRAPSDGSPSGTFFNAGGEDNSNEPASFLPEEFLERTKDMSLVVPSWAPQMAVLRHEATGAFWSHCGWNSTLESVANGVPMIAWPLYAEQRMNATVLEEDIGVAVKPVVEAGKEVVTRDEIERVVRMMIEGEERKAMRCRAEELKESAAKALSSPGGSSFESLSRVVKEWKAQI